MKGVLLTRAPGVSLIDLSHSIAPQDISSAARLLQESASWYPEGTVHLAVVDPGVGTDRPIVLVQAAGQRYVAPDNGLLGWVNEDSIEKIVQLNPALVKPAGDSTTFHGRDQMAPAAALLALGSDLSKLGVPYPSLCKLGPSPKPITQANRLLGKIVEIDRYGNLITNIPAELLAGVPRDDRLRVVCDEHETFGLWRTYGEQPAQTLMALVGSMTMVELAISNGNAAEMLGIRVGTSIEVTWKDSPNDVEEDRGDS